MKRNEELSQQAEAGENPNESLHENLESPNESLRENLESVKI